MTAARRRILMLTPAVPSDSGNGLAMRLGLFLEALAQVGDVDLLVIPLAGRANARRTFVAASGAREVTLRTVMRLDTRFALLSRIGDDAKRLEAFRSYGRPSLAASVTPMLQAEVAALVGREGYDLVHVGRLYLSEAVTALSGPLLSLDLDEDDPTSFRSRAHEGATGWAEAEADALDALLGRTGARFALLTIASAGDAAAVGERHSGLVPRVVPNAVALAGRSRDAEEDATLIFVGSLDYRPNCDGLLWFAEEVWPRISARADLAPRLLIAGANPPEAIAALALLPGIEVLGFVADLAALYARATLAIAPMRSGGGTRIKVLEAAAHGVPCVATPQAMAGLDLGQDAGWRAASAADFAAACLEAIERPDERQRRGDVAFAAVNARYDRVKIAAALAEHFRRALPQ